MMRPRNRPIRRRDWPLCAALASAALLLAGCNFAPVYQRPSLPATPANYLEVHGWQQAVPADDLSRGPWWGLFGDAGLDALEVRLAGANQDLRAALARLDQARAQTRIARSYLIPTVNASLTPTRYAQSLNSPTYVRTNPVVDNDLTLQADTNYEVDLWGRIRNGVAAARASERASAADLATLDLSLHAELATDYFTLRSEDAQQGILDQTVATYAQALQLTENLYRGGAAPISDVQQAQAQLQTARTQAADIRLRRAQDQHAIAVLLGASPSTFQLPAQPLSLALSPPAIETGLPSALLERRPDVAAAERRIRAANANIGVARAAYFPTFSLLGAAGFESTTLSNLVSAPSWMWSAGSAVVQTLIDGGLRRARSAQAHAQYDEQVADYRSTVLQAYQDVEDQIAALRQLQQESASQALAVQAAQAALDQAQYQYRAGVVTYLQIVASQTAALNARLAALDIETRRLAASIALIKALGGGWQG